MPKAGNLTRGGMGVLDVVAIERAMLKQWRRAIDLLEPKQVRRVSRETSDVMQ